MNTMTRNSSARNATASQPRREFQTWQTRLKDILHHRNKVSAAGTKAVSFRTMESREQVIFKAFRDLRELGFRIEDPSNFKPKHVQALFSHWEKKNLCPATINNALTHLRVFCTWIGKPGMIGRAETYASEGFFVKCQTSATEPKGWDVNGVNSSELLEQVRQFDNWVGMQMMLMRAFGLRRKEAICLRPHLADRGAYLAVSYGTKGGRDRTVPIDSPEKRATLDAAKLLVGDKRDTVLAAPGRTLKQNINRFKYVALRFGITKDLLGVTSHGLRHQYANVSAQKLTGFPSPVEGGVKGQVPPEEERIARILVTEELGHCRPSVTTAYLGSYKNVERVRRKREEMSALSNKKADML